MTNMIHAVCAECGIEFDYDLKPGFPRKYCPDCSAKKKESFNALQKVPKADDDINHTPQKPDMTPLALTIRR